MRIKRPSFRRWPFFSILLLMRLHHLLLILSALFHIHMINAQTIKDFQWKNRILILSSNAANTSSVDQAIQKINGAQQNVQERDLMVLILNKDKFYTLENELVDLKPVASLNTLNDGYILIGKDGGIKAQEPYPLDLKKLFDLIDSMPMRKSEIKSKY
ncbi:protein of unknown function [Maribacter sedimenticola]|uniref:DUF4174 domain-containing protein n=1 Tax=Maribacter sedimenticola TaxID=228956 RepID=A0ABY1SMP8_9FLAO|nr:DUF4174 domain-containing protein [Maribacter sedimenticola]SNR79127.1 protein of unknown function [Maribacter sedimenticola]